MKPKQRSQKVPELERDIKLRIKKLLDKLGIDSWRMQAGGYRGRTRGLPKGTPDILSAPILSLAQNANVFANVSGTAWFPVYLWIETKTVAGKPTKEQLEFAEDKQRKGHFWIVARSEDDVLNWLKENHAR